MGDVGLQSDIWATDTKVSAERIVASEFMLEDVWIGEKANFVYVDGRTNDSVYLRSIKLIQSLEGQKTYARKTDKFATKVYVFVSKNGTYLKRLFDKTQPARNELVFYIEDKNEEDLLSGAYVHIKMGSSLGRNGRQYALASHDEFKEVVSDLKEEHDLEITPEEISTLIKYGELKSIRIKTLDGLYRIISAPQIVLADVFELIGDKILAGTGVIRDFIQFKPYEWDPDAKWDEKDGKKPAFRPVLLIPQDLALDAIEALSSDTIKAISPKEIRKNVHKKASDLIAKLRHLALDTESITQKPNGFKEIIESIKKVMGSITGVVDKIERAILQGLESMISFFVKLGKNALSALNAYYCGLWNSIADALIGLVDTVGFLLTLLAAQGEFAKDFSGNMAWIMELVDEAIQAVVNFDYALFLKRIDAKFKDFNFSSILNEISTERIYYAMGAMAGFVIEILVDILTSVGTKSIANIGRKLGSWGNHIAETIQKTLKQSIGETTKEAGLALLNTIERIIRFINSGAEKVAEMLEVIFRKIGLLANVTDEAVKGVLRGLGISFDQIKEIFSKAGYKIIDAADGKLAFKKICS